MNRNLIVVFAALVFCMLFCNIAWGQATAQISGTVKDPTGASLAGVQVTATQTDTAVSRSTTTNESGSFVLPNLPLGPYRLEAVISGFRTYVQTGLVLQVDDNLVINPALAVGQVNEQVEVQANATLVETRSTQVSQVIENDRILQLPLNGRQATDLITLSGAATQNTNFTGADADRAMKGSVQITVAGGFVSGTVYLLDGAMHNDPYNNLNIPLPFPDALQEFKLETGTQASQAGLYSGASVTAVTKSGTNQFHGDLFEFLRNDLFNAKSYFSATQSTLKRNQFGGTFGGPIKKNTLFFFGGFQETILRQDPSDLKGFVPTASMLAGDFTAITSPACNGGRQIALKAPYVNNRINPALFDSVVLKLTALLPQAQDQCGAVTFGVRTVSNEWQLPVKIDYQLSAKQTFFGRYLATHYYQPTPYDLTKNLLTTTVVGFDNFAQSLAFGDTYVIGTNKVNSFRLALNRSAINRIGPQFLPSLASLGINATNYNVGQIGLAVTGGPALGVNFGPIDTSTVQTSDDLSIVKGSHQIALGASLAQWRSYLTAQVFSKGLYTFNGSVTNMGMADFLIGKMSSFMQAPPNTTNFSEWYLGVYAADTWRATPQLTVNYGLRWEPGFPQVLRNGIISNFSEARYAAGVHTGVFTNAPFGFQYPGDPGFPGANCESSGICTASGENKQWKKVAPRVGLAWDPKGDGSMSIRAAYSLGYDLNAGSFYSTFINAPWNPSIIVTNAPNFENPYGNFVGGNPFPLAAITKNAVFPANSNYFSVPTDPAATTRHSWSLSVQKQIGTNWVATASYIGSHVSHVWGSVELNTAIFIPGNSPNCVNPFNGVASTLGLAAGQPCSSTANNNARRYLTLKYPNIGGTPISYNDEYMPIGSQSYNGMLLSLQRRLSRGITLGANYTWSHCLGLQATSQTSGGTPGTTYQSPTNPGFDFGPCDFDRRQIFNMTALAETPQFSNAWFRRIGSAWNLSVIYKKATGIPVNITSGVDQSLTGVQAQRPNQIMSNVYGNGSNTEFWNPAAFAPTALGTLGNLQRNSVYGPGTWQFDVAMFRDFKLYESQKLEARFEVFNVLNSLNQPGNPIAVLNSAIFGQINSSYGGPRIMQFSMKYIF